MRNVVCKCESQIRVELYSAILSAERQGYFLRDPLLPDRSRPPPNPRLHPRRRVGLFLKIRVESVAAAEFLDSDCVGARAFSQRRWSEPSHPE